MSAAAGQASFTPSGIGEIRNIAYLAALMGISRQLATTKATAFGGYKVGREWRFTDAGIALGIARLAEEEAAKQNSPRSSTSPVRPASAVLERIGRQLAS